MAFPTKALLTGAATGLVMRIFGLPTWFSVAFGSLTFMATGGLLYIKLILKTLPRDLW